MSLSRNVILDHTETKGYLYIYRSDTKKNHHSFNSKTGYLEVDYKNWISKQDIVYNRPINDPPDAVAASRLGLGDTAYDGINLMCLNHQIRTSGFHIDNNDSYNEATYYLLSFQLNKTFRI